MTLSSYKCYIYYLVCGGLFYNSSHLKQHSLYSMSILQENLHKHLTSTARHQARDSVTFQCCKRKLFLTTMVCMAHQVLLIHRQQDFQSEHSVLTLTTSSTVAVMATH